jgi:arylsulfatase
MTERQKKIILISIDTLRADHLGCYGYYRNTSPNIDKMAGESMFFRHAFSPVSYTAPSFASLFTSKYPSYHHIEFTNGRFDFPENIEPMLQRILNSNGMQTAAFISTPVLNAKRTKFNEGFDVYDDEANTKRTRKVNAFLYRRGEETAKLALEWLDKNHMNDLFLWIHFMDVHGPYSPPGNYSEVFVQDEYWDKMPISLNITPAYNDTYKDVVPDNYVPGIPGYQALKKQYDKEGKVISYEKNLDYYISQYDGSIKYVDDQVGRIIERLRQLNIYDDTMVMIHSDHGEAFGENGLYCDHGATVSLEQIHVPLIMKLPEGKENIITQPVSLIDVTPSVLDYYGCSNGKNNFHGVSFFSDAPVSNRIIYSQFLKQLSCIDSDHQFLYGKGWFEREMGNMFGPDVNDEYLKLNAQQSITDFRTYEDIKESGSDAMKSFRQKMETNIIDFIKRANDRKPVKLHEESVSDDEKEAIREQLSALGYTD